MAVPSSGELRLYADIGVELGVPQSNVSLGSMSDSAGFAEPDAMSDFYGYVDAVAPSVTTNNISNVGTTSLTANGNVTSDGGATITERGFYVGTNSSSPTNNTKYTVSGTTGFYSRNITVSDNTTYYCWAFATNSAGTTYGSRVQATTQQLFTPTYASGGEFRPSNEIRNTSGSTYSFTFYLTRYYINPFTSALVQYYSDSTSFNVPDLNDTGTWSYGGQSNSSFVTNALNEFRSGVSTGCPNYELTKLQVNASRAGSSTFSNYSGVNGGTNGLYTLFSSTNVLTRISSRNYNTSGSKYVGIRTNYS